LAVTPRQQSEDDRWWIIAFIFLLLLVAILIESVTHPKRDAEIIVTDSGVTIEPLPEQAA
jgi:hypothetical protein